MNIWALVRNATGVDLRLYQPGIVRLRIERRIALRNIDTLDAYAQLLVEDRNELNALYDDMFIDETGFFRDPDNLQGLRDTVFARILSGRGPLDIRAWVPGCSTGEEVYTIGMLLFEQLGERQAEARIQIFGTALSDRAIARARNGIYVNLTDVTPERQQRFFGRVEGEFGITKSLRDLCVFGRHDLTKDPPLPRMDLIVCRNLLISMRPTLRNRVIATFHYALRPEGYLLVGRTDSLGCFAHLFSEEDSGHAIYARARFTPPSERVVPDRHAPPPDPLDEQVRATIQHNQTSLEVCAS